MTRELDIRVDPRTAALCDVLRRYVASYAAIDEGRIKQIDLLRRSIDARQKKVLVNLRVRVHIDEICKTDDIQLPEYKSLPDDAPQAVVVGAGPAGLFAALALIEQGIRPIVLERGKDVDSRRKDLALISRNQTVDPESNYAFGEGGAGAYSDGKLYTRSKKRGDVNKILNILHAHGASKDILIDAHPHIGTNRLPEIVKAIRNTIIDCGGEVRFNEKVTELLFDERHESVIGVKTAADKEYFGPVILATGHSARDVYRYLNMAGVLVEPKGIAVGVRLEHPAHLIDSLQYHTPEGRGKYLPAAEYSMLTRVDNRAVYSFCMCPGGVVVPAASGPEQLVVNGMSSANRLGRWSNSGMVVEVLPEDIKGEDALRMMHFQEDIEKTFHKASGATQNAPAQRMLDFVHSKPSKDLPASSYAPGIHPSRIDELLPDFVSCRLRKGFEVFGSKQPGFLTNDAVLIGAETRTSSPVRVPRDAQTLSHVQFKGLYPAGEGAGYAGGIVSAAIDGERCALSLAQELRKKNKNIEEV